MFDGLRRAKAIVEREQIDFPAVDAARLVHLSQQRLRCTRHRNPDGGDGPAIGKGLSQLDFSIGYAGAVLRARDGNGSGQA